MRQSLKLVSDVDLVELYKRVQLIKFNDEFVQIFADELNERNLEVDSNNKWKNTDGANL